MVKKESNKVIPNSILTYMQILKLENKLTILWKRDNELNLLAGPTKRCNRPKMKPELLRSFHAKIVSYFTLHDS